MSDEIIPPFDELPKTADEARRWGSRWYYTGKPCKRGHIAPRFTSVRRCVLCVRESTAEWREDNIDRARELGRENKQREYERNPQKFIDRTSAYYLLNRDDRMEDFRNYRLDNLESEREKDREYQRTHKVERAAYKKAKWLSDPEPIRVRNRNRKARERNAEGYHTADDIHRIRAEQGDRCNECKIDLEGKGEVDHIHPLAKGGSNWPWNLQLLCGPCNGAKGAKYNFD